MTLTAQGIEELAPAVLTPELRHSVGTAQIQAADQELNHPIGQAVSGSGHITNSLRAELLVPVRPGQKEAYVTAKPVM